MNTFNLYMTETPEHEEWQSPGFLIYRESQQKNGVSDSDIIMSWFHRHPQEFRDKFDRLARERGKVLHGHG